MTLRHFKIFVAVCDTMNMTLAAQSLYMSQSAVSQTIAEMESYYDTRLFERLSRRLYLTLAGEKLLSYARHMIRMNSDIEKEMKQLHENGAIRIGASVTIGANVLPGLVSAFSIKNENTDIVVFEENTERIENMILQDQIDLALVEGDTTSSDVIACPFMEDALTIICAPGHRFADMKLIEPCELEKEPFIIRELGSGTRKTFEDEMTAHKLSYKVTWTCNNADTIKMAVEAGLGVSVISRRAVERELAGGLLMAVAAKGIRFERTFKIVYHKNKYLTESMQRFVELCKR